MLLESEYSKVCDLDALENLLGVIFVREAVNECVRSLDCESDQDCDARSERVLADSVAESEIRSETELETSVDTDASEGERVGECNRVSDLRNVTDKPSDMETVGIKESEELRLVLDESLSVVVMVLVASPVTTLDDVGDRDFNEIVGEALRVSEKCRGVSDQEGDTTAEVDMLAVSVAGRISVPVKTFGRLRDLLADRETVSLPSFERLEETVGADPDRVTVQVSVL